MKQILIYKTLFLALLMGLIILMNSCAPQKGCKGLKAHPNYSKNWKR